MRILVPVDGSDSANRAAAHAVALVKGRADAEIILLNVQRRRPSNICGVISPGGAHTRSVRNSIRRGD